MRPSAAIAIGLAALVGADALLWQAGVDRLQAGLDRWVETARAHNGSVILGTRETGGWPFAATVAVAGVQIAGADRLMPGGLAWSADQMVLRLALAHPSTLAVEVAGNQRLRLSHAPELVFGATGFSARIALWSTQPFEAELHAQDLAGGMRGSPHPQDVQIGTLQLHIAGQTSRNAALLSARLHVQARDIGLPDIGRWPLGALVSSLDGTIQLTSPPGGTPAPDTPPAPSVAPRVALSTAPGTPAPSSNPEDQARQWRDGGGRLHVEDLHLHWGPIRLAADATLGLDDRLQPAGIGRADVAGSSQALDALVGGGVVGPGLAATGKAILAVMAHAPDQPDEVRLPFVLRDSTLSIGQIPLVRLNTIAWRRQKPNP